jgi:hypothetical protein
MEEIKKLLEQISIINKKNAEILDASGGFNIFRICGVDHYENKHSKIIAEFLNPAGSHGLKSELLKQFVELLGEILIVKNFNIESARVSTEYSMANGRIDILIEDGYHALIIENKIYAQDQGEQLARYDEFACKQYGKGNYQILYLTLFGNDASKQSTKDVDYKNISYKETIIGWLEKCVQITEHHPMVCETLKQYVNHLKQLINNNIMDNNPELRAFVVENLDAIKKTVEIYKVHRKRPNRILWLLSNKLKDKGVEMGKLEPEDVDTSYAVLKLGKNDSGTFEIDFVEDGIHAYYYNKTHTELEDKLNAKGCKMPDEYYYTESDETIAESIAKQINAIIDVINENKHLVS